VHAAELGVFASRAVWTVLTAIGPEFEKNSGHKLNTTTGHPDAARILLIFLTGPKAKETIRAQGMEPL
jgi:ABC-type molybdate transport system substrate-binding protein